MSINNRLSNEYYNISPHGFIETGDIFSNLPTLGLLKKDFLPGIIITPACDLSNVKTETITYLPIIPINEWVCTISFYPNIKTELINLCSSFKMHSQNDLDKHLPESVLLQSIYNECCELKLSKEKDISKQNKIKLGIQMIEDIIDREKYRFKPNVLNNFYPKTDDFYQRIISNSFASDLHFIPKDKESIILDSHSLILFRYPITIPYELLNYGKDINTDDEELWKNFIDKSPPKVCYSEMKKIPLRGLRLNQDYLSDMLTRYISLFVRIGSPDLDKNSIEEIKEHLKTEKNR